MHKRNKVYHLIFLFVVCCLLMAGCGQEEVVTEEGKMLFLTAEEVGQYDLAGREGFFVLNEDLTFTPMASEMSGFTGIATESDSTRFLWYTDTAFSITNLIPKVSPNTKLVLLANSLTTIPNSITLEEYNYKGVSVGMHFYTDTAGSMYISTESPLKSSEASVITQVSGEKAYKLLAVNGSSELPLGNVDNGIQMLLGMEEGKRYSFEFLKGTKYLKLDCTADTKVYQAGKLTTIVNPYEITKEGYFIINLPDNLSEGYYYINNAGMFFFNPAGKE